MSLFSSIQLANNSLIAAQIGLQVAGNNIANANTPGYIRQEVVLEPAPTQRLGSLLLGLGVEVSAIIQKTDDFLEQRLRSSISDLANGDRQEKAHLELEALIGELNDTDLSTSLTSFFGSINDILNQPESISVRNLAVLKGATLAADVRRLATRVIQLRRDANKEVISAAADINRLTKEIAQLNVQIVTAEGGNVIRSDAVGLRDKRLLALKELSSIINIVTLPQISGAINVQVGGDFLVSDGLHREVRAVASAEGAENIFTIQLVDTDSNLEVLSGKLQGLYAARDEILGGFLDQLDEFAKSLIFEFNRIHSSGQGLKGHRQLTSEFAVSSADAPLDQANLPFVPVNGSLQVHVFNRQTGLTQTADVFVRLSGLGDDTTLAGLAAAIDAVDGISATVTASRRLSITSDSSNLEFAFADDTSGILAALGLSTFFTGAGALDIGVSSVVRDDPSKFAASRSGVGEDTENAVALAGFLDRGLDSQDGETLANFYQRLVGETTQAASVARAVANGFRVFQQTLEGQQLAISGVSLDEEAVKMITFQRAYQASARFIATINELLETLVNL
jgi:flagellar hook-associated protein 1 FlgK